MYAQNGTNWVRAVSLKLEHNYAYRPMFGEVLPNINT